MGEWIPAVAVPSVAFAVLIVGLLWQQIIDFLPSHIAVPSIGGVQDAIRQLSTVVDYHVVYDIVRSFTCAGQGSMPNSERMHQGYVQQLVLDSPNTLSDRERIHVLGVNPQRLTICCSHPQRVTSRHYFCLNNVHAKQQCGVERLVYDDADLGLFKYSRHTFSPGR